MDADQNRRKRRQGALYVNGAEQPALIVNDVKSGASASGKIALWVGAETVAHFRNLTVTRRN